MDSRMDSIGDAKRGLLREAETLARQLHAESVKRADLEQVVSPLLHSPGGWSERLTRARKMTKALPGSWLRRRSNDMPRRLRVLQSHLLPLLERHSSEPYLRFVLGWTSRLLHIAEKEAGD